MVIDGWHDAHLEDIAELTVGHVGTMANEYVPSGIPFLRSLNVEPFRINTNDLKYINRDFHMKLSKSQLHPGDLVIVRTGKPGACAIIPDWLKEANCSDIVIVRPNSMVDNQFLMYYINSIATPHVAAHLVGAVQQHFNVGSAKKILVHFPSLTEQRTISHILSTLDKKIELNRKMNQTLESISQAIFNSWFVDFDPVKAKASGESTESICHRLGITPEILALFPDSLEDSSRGEIPKGWNVKSIEILCDSITSGGTPARKNIEYWEGGTIPWFKTGELLDGPLLDSEEKITPKALDNSSCKLWPAGTILFALYASPTVGKLGVLSRPGTSNQAAAGLIAKQKYGVPFLKQTLLSVRAELQNIAVGAAQQNINQGILKSHPVVVPRSDAALHFSNFISPLFEQQKSLLIQSSFLISIRDTLLPKLLSGEVSVKPEKVIA